MGLYHQMPCLTSIVLVYKCSVIDIFSVSNFYFFVIAVLSCQLPTLFLMGADDTATIEPIYTLQLEFRVNVNLSPYQD